MMLTWVLDRVGVVQGRLCRFTSAAGQSVVVHAGLAVKRGSKCRPAYLSFPYLYEKGELES